ncbi:ABC transporter ATP-binding protein [Psychrobium sp. 1_MG-2023]|uniref:ABC transporter ATP-binding protein n=1 Tax=Psychrobium sp. 1_MG-2023 TaxID=3062624 RepID=UPI000C3479E6|nr:ABC transporter ATP-binding protein [Psychrobium sp. 1_MG-2023]MDP2561561.1 ABC transporter ATP-binding protein [Psychrobium sp. 1_MG-2023]PKF55023.1 ABC transporter ATP-binding protein [Alteromonadales bacterium alter-6D02]
MTATLEINQISFNYGPKKALDKVTFAIKPGFNVLLGPNGAGKSTLISLLTRLTKVDSGNILCDGFDLEKETAKVMRLFGVVFQQSTLDLDLSIKQNLVYHGALHGLSAKQSLSNVMPLLEEFELSSRLGDKVRSLNGGHRRRVELVRALLHKPKVLLLDEASVGLDNPSRHMIINYLRQCVRQEGLAVLWTTHLLDEINASDYLIMLNQGRVAQQGQVSTLLAQYAVNDVQALYAALTDAFAFNKI